MASQREIDNLLKKIGASYNESVLSRSAEFEGELGDESTSYNWHGISEDEATILRAAVRLGLLTETYSSWEPDDAGNPRLGGGDYVAELTGAGTARLLIVTQPWWKTAFGELRSSVYTILFSVIVAVSIAYAIDYVGLK